MAKLYATDNNSKDPLVLERTTPSALWKLPKGISDVVRTGPGQFSVVIDGRSHRVLVLKEDKENKTVRMRIGAHTYTVQLEDEQHHLAEVPVSFTQATLGAEIDIPTLEGRKKLTVPRGTQHGHLFRMAGAGLPNLRSGRKGDMAVITKIEVPIKLTSKQEELLREFAKTEHEKLLPQSSSFFKKVKGWLGD